MSVPRARLLDLMKVGSAATERCLRSTLTRPQAQCRIFSTAYNPERLRTGNKILHQRLKGPALAAYYPRRLVTFKTLQNAFPDQTTWNEEEEERKEHIQAYVASRSRNALWVMLMGAQTEEPEQGSTEEEEDRGRFVWWHLCGRGVC